MIEYLSGMYGFLIGKQLVVPLWEIIAYVTFITYCLLFGRHSLGLIISYCFVFYWGYVFNRHNLMDMFYETTWGTSVYAISGLAMFVTAVIGFFIDNKEG